MVHRTLTCLESGLAHKPYDWNWSRGFGMHHWCEDARLGLHPLVRWWCWIEEFIIVIGAKDELGPQGLSMYGIGV
jgi:hypothetical protein